VVWCVLALNWTWLAEPKYQGLILQGIWTTIWILVVTMVLGMLLAIPLGLAQAAGPWWLALPARLFCGLIRGTPLLLAALAFVLRAGVAVPVDPWIRETWYLGRSCGRPGPMPFLRCPCPSRAMRAR
jgi:polar amino acid transport system permease protein